MIHLVLSENGANILVPLSETGSGLYSIQFSAAGFVGFSEEVELTESSCGNSPNCMFYTTMSPTPGAGVTRAMMSWDDSVEGLDFSVYRIDRNLPITESGCLLKISFLGIGVLYQIILWICVIFPKVYFTKMLYTLKQF